MKAILGFILTLSVGFAFPFRVTQGLDEAQRAVTQAFRAGAKDKAPYLYAKAKSYKDIASILASETDDIGSKLFSIKALNLASKAINASLSKGNIKKLYETESITDINDVIYEKVYTVDEYFPEDDEELFGRRLKEEASLIGETNLIELYEKLVHMANNRGRMCAPGELGRAEAFYEALLYQIGKERTNSALILKFYNEAMALSSIAFGKLKTAMENELECYTGVKKVFQLSAPERKESIERAPEREEPVVTEEHLKITARIHFDFDKYEIKREYIPILNEIARVLKENDYLKVRIEGFTDIIGSKEYNDKLALKRAKAVKEYLIKKGVPEEKIEVVGFGKERFIASNRNSIGRLTNRRVEFILIKLQED